MSFMQKIGTAFLLVALFILALSCSNSKRSLFEQAGWRLNNDIHPKTQRLDLSKFSKIVYVSKINESNLQNGTKQYPFGAIKAALESLNNLSENSQAAVLVSQGIYTEETIYLIKYVHLFGGFNPKTWERDIDKYETVLTNDKEGRLIIAENSTTIDGFIIRGARYRGKGAAIYCEGTSPMITNNFFIDDMSLKPLNWKPKYWHETANDGGAIYGKDGASPIIKNNLFIENKTECGRGGACAFDNQCNPKIIDNVFYRNQTGLDDPMRSSDGGAVSIFRWSKGLIEGNIFLSNSSHSNNDAGALFVALWSSPVIRNNIFVDNESGDDAGALFVGGQEHRYDKPLDTYPPKDKFYVIIENNTFIGNRNPSMNSGAMRFTMESRGKFSKNVVAQNNGIYFQRSETEITDNIILDKMLVIETKESLGKSLIKNNIIWADFVLDQTIADVQNNNLLDADSFNGNQKLTPEFKDDGLLLLVYSAYFVKDKNYSELIVNNNSIPNLIGRIVKSDDKWSIVKSYKDNTLQIWGNFSGVTQIQVLPTYTLNTK
ncbi:right-handed parallel beta-helix repeat-containing protein [Melioribacteraceae bacterium 4301-Me]|uniref:right-handed parallel beta-helix repeat-containing protein n=1 Tax=Pyranulibacter aquaticus TaxID=3163344 RepID=UPI0035957DF6